MTIIELSDDLLAESDTDCFSGNMLENVSQSLDMSGGPHTPPPASGKRLFLSPVESRDEEFADPSLASCEPEPKRQRVESEHPKVLKFKVPCNPSDPEDYVLFECWLDNGVDGDNDGAVDNDESSDVDLVAGIDGISRNTNLTQPNTSPLATSSPSPLHGQEGSYCQATGEDFNEFNLPNCGHDHYHEADDLEVEPGIDVRMHNETGLYVCAIDHVPMVILKKQILNHVNRFHSNARGGTRDLRKKLKDVLLRCQTVTVPANIHTKLPAIPVTRASYCVGCGTPFLRKRDHVPSRRCLFHPVITLFCQFYFQNRGVVIGNLPNRELMHYRVLTDRLLGPLPSRAERYRADYS